MSSSDLAISVRGLGKSYTIRHQHESHITLAEQALSRLRHPLRRPEREAFWALDDVNFDVRHGEVLGIIGRNGAGKSTLLKVLSRITAPTKGEVRLYGRIGSLLEVGTGFHPELTGRENVYLNGSILGMKTKEIDAQFDAIVDFAGVEKFLDTPVKRYSSGMYVRLAFAVAAHLETEIVLLDEVLAVGDAEFQRRSLALLATIAESGRTVLLVSHQMPSVTRVCDSVCLLDRGRLAHFGDTATGIDRYRALNQLTGAPAAIAQTGALGEIQVLRATVQSDVIGVEEPLVLAIDLVRLTERSSRCYLQVLIRNEQGAVVTLVDSRRHVDWLTIKERITVTVDVQQPQLPPGKYSIDLLASDVGIHHHVRNAASFVCSGGAVWSDNISLPDGPPMSLADFGISTLECAPTGGEG